ncbi:cytochrome ubiquinol oxidase subunit I [Spirillospora sp. NPDC047279]|uniref:cytochrome ubiquinol oxidase subunit I n=1 Tax=Spirillospora sp. NPDC047279 TaxID=3155478 RepID=UPI0033E42CE9
MDALMLARVQFALTAGSHFLFVALTLGLATLVAVTQTRATVSGSVVHARMTRFWGQLYVINYAVGIVTGLVMEFQFGLNWGGMSTMVGGVFGAPLAMETIIAFFVESTFLGLWIFGWDRLNRWAHLALIWVVTLTAYFSAYFILVANGWLQRPVGYEMAGGTARLTDLGALMTNPPAVLAFFHVLFGGLLTAGFFMAGVSAYHLLRRTADVEFFRRSMRIGLLTVILSVGPVVTFGGMQYQDLQPTKSGSAERVAAQVAEFTARFGPGDYTPPALSEAGMITMVMMWLLMGNIALIALVKLPFGTWLVRGRVFHVLMIASVPLPYIAMLSGWVFREVGRQPWMVYGVLKTEDALSDVGPGLMTASFTAFTSLFAVLIAVNVWLLARYARRGPQAARLGAAPAPEPAAPALTATF